MQCGTAILQLISVQTAQTMCSGMQLEGTSLPGDTVSATEILITASTADIGTDRRAFVCKLISTVSSCGCMFRCLSILSKS